jgi:hypothetical protein
MTADQSLRSFRRFGGANAANFDRIFFLVFVSFGARIFFDSVPNPR